MEEETRPTKAGSFHGTTVVQLLFCLVLLLHAWSISFLFPDHTRGLGWLALSAGKSPGSRESHNSAHAQ